MVLAFKVPNALVLVGYLSILLNKPATVMFDNLSQVVQLPIG